MMPRACRHNQRGFAALPGACLPYHTLLRQKEKHMGGFKQVPPKRAEAGVWVVPGPALWWHRDCFWQNCHHTPHKWSHSSFIKGSKNICWIIKGSHSTAYVLARLFDSLKSPV